MMKSFKRVFDFDLAQYNIISNEYLSALKGVQTVITINLAASIGVLAAMVALKADYMKISHNLCILALSLIGIICDIASIRTIEITKKQLVIFQKQLEEKEKLHCSKVIHRPNYYKGLHITNMVFIFYAIIFLIILSLSTWQILMLIIKNSNIVIEVVLFIILLVCYLALLFFVARCSDIIYEQHKKRVPKWIENMKNESVN